MHILVVDDELEIREVLHEALAMHGYSVTGAASAGQALAALEERPYDLVILDIKMPGESGDSLLRKVREVRKDLPVIIYTASVTQELETRLKAEGANEVFQKTMKIDLLTSQVSSILKAKRAAESASASSERNVLIVDDEPDIRDMLAEFFKSKNCKTLTASDGEAAIAIVKSGIPISVVLLDFSMPGLNGIQTLEQIRSLNKTLGVVMMTANNDIHTVSRAMELGAYSYILKPFDFLYLETVVLSKLMIAGL